MQSGSHKVAVKPNEWKNGSTPSITSSGCRRKTRFAASMFDTMLACVSMTPFGTPVLPLEKMIVASASGEVGARNRRSIAGAGRRRAAASIAARAGARVRARTSSRKIIPRSVSMPAFFTNAREVRIVSMPQRSIAAAIASWPAVKFRLTGTAPANVAAMFASAPPTDAGSSSPMGARAGTSRPIARDSSSAATSVRPNVSSRPVESAMQSAGQRRLACRTNRDPSVSAIRRRFYQCVFQPARCRFWR